MVGGIGALVVVLACWRMFPALVRVDRFEEHAAKTE
jgi:hypothetical protein